MVYVMSAGLIAPRPSRASSGLLLAFALIVPLTSGSQESQQRTSTPNSADALFQSAGASLAQGKYKEAEEAFHKVYELEPTNLRGIVGVARVYIAQNRTDEAIQLLQAEAKKNPTRLDYRVAIGDVAMLAAKYDLALEQYLMVLKHVGADSNRAGDLYLHIGEAYLGKGEIDFSLIFLRQAKELLPRNGKVLGTLGLALASAGQKDAAALEYRAALDVDPNAGETLNNLAFLLADDGSDLDAALAYAQRAKQLLPNSLAVADTLGWVYLKNNKTEEAIVILHDVVQKDPAKSAYRYHLAVALEQKGDHSAAKKELMTALNDNPSKHEEQTIKELLQKVGK
jgi:tetratricopeptide (TPR) repeat protein